MLAVMEAYGTITPAMRLAGLAFGRVVLTGEPAVLRQLGMLGCAGGVCAVEILGLGRSLREWARHGWQGRPIAQETASGILTAVLAQLALGEWQPTATTPARIGGRLRAAALRRDQYRCTVKGCRARATHVDHIVTRPRQTAPSAADRLDNLRSLCATHDAQIKEHHGVRGRGGVPAVKGCDTQGWPFASGFRQ
jgi:hypothetical protein